MAEKEPFKVAVPAEALTDLRSRLKKTRWAGDFGNEGWAYGTNLEALKELVDYWQKGFNWRRQEREINRFSHYKTTIEGIPIHFIHEPGKGPRMFIGSTQDGYSVRVESIQNELQTFSFALSLIPFI